MTPAEFANFIEASRVSLGEVNRLCCGPEAPVRLQRWGEILVSVELNDALRCLDEIEEGRLEPPRFADEWTRYATFVRKWCKSNPTTKIDYVTVHFAEEPRYRCHLCRDSGLVPCINAKWLDAQRATIENGTRPSELRRYGFGWCRANNAGPLCYAMACKCGTGERRVNIALRGRFDDNSHVRDDGDFDGSCLTWLHAHAAAQPAGYYTEFV